MNEQDSWVPEQVPEKSRGIIRDSAEPQGNPYDQPFGVGKPPPTFNSRTSTADSFTAHGRAGATNSSSMGHGLSSGQGLSIVEGLALAWAKTREHLLEWLFFTVILGAFSFALVWLSMGFYPEDVDPLVPETGDAAGLVLGGEFLLQVWLLICGAMAVQAALEMMRGRQVHFLAFFRVVNPLTILVLAFSFGAVAAGLTHFLHRGEYFAVLVEFFAVLAMAGATDTYDGPIRACGRALAFFVEAPWPMTKLLIATVVFSVGIGFVPVLGGILGTAIFALLIAYGFRTMLGHSPR